MLAPELAPSTVSPEVDRKQLTQISKRFMAINDIRLERVRSVLRRNELLFLDILPLLFHVNHPMLPGYVSHRTPAGVSGYTPSKTAIDRAKSLSRSFTYHRQPTGLRQVHAIYLMGSTGTIAHSDRSDLDVWVCYPHSLSSAALIKLTQKAHAIEQWAAAIGVEAHLFLMNGEKFISGDREALTGENCGTAQHYLLLDEFYRTGILLAGRKPLWWLVPPEEEYRYADYAATLVRKRFVRRGTTLDFGGISTIPPEEFIGAGIWQLYKAIASPHKSVLKLLLTEVYASEAPNTVCLSTLFKQAIYNSFDDPDELDPYMMVCRKLESHLRAYGNEARLQLVHRCFYYKVGKKLSRPPNRGIKSWQRQLMEKLAEEWSWHADVIRECDQRDRWKIAQLIGERKELVGELTASYRFLSDFARLNSITSTIDAQELSVLGRKLYAAFERKAGKIDIINQSGSPQVAEADLTVCSLGRDKSGTRVWGLYPDIIGAKNETECQPLRQSVCITELFAWAIRNRVIDDSSRLHVREDSAGLSASEAGNMIKAIRRSISESLENPIEDGDSGPFAKSAYLVNLQMFVNVGVDPMAKLKARGLQRLSNQTDSLGFSGLRENLVVNIETLCFNSWGEMIASRYQGPDALVRCIREYLQMTPRDDSQPFLPGIDIHSFCQTRATAIVARVSELLQDLTQYYYRGGSAEDARYIIQIENGFCLLQARLGIVHSQYAANENALIDLLGAAQQHWTPVVIDRYALQRSPLSPLARKMRKNRVLVSIETSVHGCSLLIIDEHGSFYQFEVASDREQATLSAIHQFVTSVMHRQNLLAKPTDQSEQAIRELCYFRVLRRGLRAVELQIVETPIKMAGERIVPVQAIAEFGTDSEILFTIYCGDEEFSQRQLGDEFYRMVAEHLVSLRYTGEHYHCYVTDLDLSAVALETNCRCKQVTTFGTNSSWSGPLTPQFIPRKTCKYHR